MVQSAREARAEKEAKQEAHIQPIMFLTKTRHLFSRSQSILVRKASMKKLMRCSKISVKISCMMPYLLVFGCDTLKQIQESLKYFNSYLYTLNQNHKADFK